MLSLSEIKIAVNNKLKSKFQYTIYGNEIKQGYKTPCFFVSIFTNNGSQFYKNIVKKSYVVKINFFPETSDEEAMLNIADELLLLFSSKLYVKSRAVTISNITHEFVGENYDILQFGFNLDFYDDIPEPVNLYKPAKSIIISTNINKEMN